MIARSTMGLPERAALTLCNVARKHADIASRARMLLMNATHVTTARARLHARRGRRVPAHLRSRGLSALT
jgi:hypothetical protein